MSAHLALEPMLASPPFEPPGRSRPSARPVSRAPSLPPSRTGAPFGGAPPEGFAPERRCLPSFGTFDPVKSRGVYGSVLRGDPGTRGSRECCVSVDRAGTTPPPMPGTQYELIARPADHAGRLLGRQTIRMLSVPFRKYAHAPRRRCARPARRDE